MYILVEKVRVCPAAAGQMSQRWRMNDAKINADEVWVFFIPVEVASRDPVKQAFGPSDAGRCLLEAELWAQPSDD